MLWLRFLKEIGGELEPPTDLSGYPPRQEALTISQEAGFSQAELLAYQDVLDAIRTETSCVGEKVAEAEAKGHERGIQLGREEGRLDEKLTIAQNLLVVMDDSAIAKITGLSMDEVQALRNA